MLQTEILKFEWDERKNNINKLKHGIGFEESVPVFYDPDAKYAFDEPHSEQEERFIVIGKNKKSKMLTVCHCYRNTDVIRLISAREATKRENRIYEGRE